MMVQVRRFVEYAQVGEDPFLTASNRSGVKLPSDCRCPIVAVRPRCRNAKNKSTFQKKNFSMNSTNDNN